MTKDERLCSVSASCVEGDTYDLIQRRLIANARLIAAAPELLEALRMVKASLYVTEPEGEYRLNTTFDECAIDAAIAKATGGDHA